MPSPLIWFLTLFLLFLLPSRSSPVPLSPVFGSRGQASASPTPVIAESPLLTTGVATPPSSSGTVVYFLPQDPNTDGFREPGSGYSDHSSFPPEPGSAPDNNTQGLHSSIGTVSTPLMMAYYPAWVAGTFPPERIDFSRFDWIDFAFAIPNENLDLDWDDADTDPAILARLVTVAHQQGKKVKLSIGGWDGSRLFSPILGSDDGRQVFVKNIATVYKEYRLDGIDIDWEYPGRLGHPRNYVDQNDTSNLLEFLKLLRKNLPSSARISAAVTPTPFADASERPMGDVRAFADVLDWFLLMNYDTWGASSNPGPNAPLNDACRNSTQPEASAFAAIGAWIKAGVPANQLVLGVPSYGYISRSNATGLRQRDEEAPPFYARPLSDTGEETGQVQFLELVNQGALCVDPNKPRAYRGCGGFTREWDACSDTPFLLSKVGGQVITYDDGQSLGLKAAYAKQLGLLGVNVFDLHGDTDQWDLTDSLRQGLGL